MNASRFIILEFATKRIDLMVRFYLIGFRNKIEFDEGGHLVHVVLPDRVAATR